MLFTKFNGTGKVSDIYWDMNIVPENAACDTMVIYY